MKIRGKLLILFLGIALTPLTILTVMGDRALLALGHELAARIRGAVEPPAQRLLHRIVADYARVIHRERQLLDLLARTQADEVRIRLAQAPPASQTIYGPAAFAGGQPAPAPDLALRFAEKYFRIGADGRKQPYPVSFQHPAILVAGGEDPAPLAADAGRLAQLARFLREAQWHHGDLVQEQFVALENGLYAVFPGHGGYPADFDPRLEFWYREQKAVRRLVWLHPAFDPGTGQVMMAVTLPLHDEVGRFLGATGVRVPLSAFLEGLDLPGQWRTDTEIHVARIFGSGAGTGVGDRRLEGLARLLADGHGGFRGDVEGGRLRSDVPAAWQRFLVDMRGRASGQRKLLYRGAESLWAYARIDDEDTYLLLIVPLHNIVAPADQARAEAERYTDEQIDLAAIFSALVVVAVGVIAWIGGQGILRPIHVLINGAQEIGRRNFAHRVHIDTGDEFEELARAFNEMVPELEERSRITESLMLAREVQQHLLPLSPPSMPGLDVAGISEFCDETGGDYYDFIELQQVDPGHLAVAVGDVAGHGIPSALLMTTVRALLHGFALSPHTPASILNLVNPLVVKDIHHGRFMTLFYLLVDRRGRRFQWASAGHGPAYRYNRLSREWDEFDGNDIPLGVEADWVFGPAVETAWRPGDCLLIATDGVWEARSESGEVFGMARVRAAVERYAALPAAALCQRLVEELKVWRGQRRAADDVTLVVIQVAETVEEELSIADASDREGDEVDGDGVGDGG